MPCNWFRDHLSAYLDESIGEDDRTRWRDHLQSCEACREWAVQAEPTLVLVAARRRRTDPQEVEACVDNVLNLIRQDRLRQSMRARSGRWLATAAAVLIVAGAGAMWRLMPAGDGEPIGADPALTAAVDEHEPGAPPEVEVDMDGEDVRIYRFATEEDENTALVFIVNPALES
jgi:predicted anti-sigma-YlaC factor YlaD